MGLYPVIKLVEFFDIAAELKYLFGYHNTAPIECSGKIPFAPDINKTAQNLKHASPKSTASDNPKYSYRTWLLRLGMIGDEYKATRKVLLKSLEGNGAFRKVSAREANG